MGKKFFVKNNTIIYENPEDVAGGLFAQHLALCDQVVYVLEPSKIINGIRVVKISYGLVSGYVNEDHLSILRSCCDYYIGKLNEQSPIPASPQKCPCGANIHYKIRKIKEYSEESMGEVENNSYNEAIEDPHYDDEAD